MRPALAVPLAALSLALVTCRGSAQAPGPRRPASVAPGPNGTDREAIERAKAGPRLGQLATIGGSVLDGTILAETVRVKSDLGELDIPLRQVSVVVNLGTATSAQFPDISYLILPPTPPLGASVPPEKPPFKLGILTADGDVILGGEIVTREFKFSCGLGVVSVPWEKVSVLDFTRRCEPVPGPVVPEPNAVPPGEVPPGSAPAAPPRRSGAGPRRHVPTSGDQASR